MDTSRARLVHRRISPQAGMALEKLAHAIEYLMDEIEEAGGLRGENDPRGEALQVLMGRNREIYFACPEVRGWGDSVRDFLRSCGA